MRLTVERDRETIRRYAHVRPARGWKVRRCSTRCPGTARTCTLEKGHRGVHVAHGWFGKVLAVWDRKGETRELEARVGQTVSPRIRRGLRRRSFPDTLKDLWGGLVGSDPSPETFIFLVMFLAFVGFAIHWLLLITGVI